MLLRGNRQETKWSSGRRLGLCRPALSAQDSRPRMCLGQGQSHQTWEVTSFPCPCSTYLSNGNILRSVAQVLQDLLFCFVMLGVES